MDVYIDAAKNCRIRQRGGDLYHGMPSGKVWRVLQRGNPRYGKALKIMRNAANDVIVVRALMKR